MIRLNQIQANSGLSVELHLIDSGDEIDLLSAGLVHQEVSLVEGDLIFLSGRTDKTENGFYVVKDEGFHRPILQENLSIGAGIVQGTEFSVAQGDHAGKKYRIISYGTKDSYGLRVNIVGTHEIEVEEEYGLEPPEVSDASYEHNQPVPLTVWTIIHNLNKYPSVTIIDSTNRVVYGKVEYTDTNQLKITFSAAFSGKAVLN